MDAAILAGGRARRFGGRDKTSLRVGGVSILDRQLAALDDVADRVLLVTREPARGGDPRVHAVKDLVPGAAALGGVYTALASAATDHVLVVACDLPFLTAPFLGRLAALAGPGHEAIVPRTRDGLQPLCAVYARGLMAPLRRRLEAGRLKVVDFLATVRVLEIGPDALAEIDPEGILFFNVNGPSELDGANELAARHGL